MSTSIYALDRGGIYNIINTITLKHYIGSAVRFEKRWRDHVNNLRQRTHRNGHLQASWNKYGEAAFEFVVIEYVEDPADLLRIEQLYLDAAFATGCQYNLSATAGSTLGVKMSQEVRAKMSERMKGNAISKGRKRSPEEIARTSGKTRAAGHKRSEQAKAATTAATCKTWLVTFPDGHTETIRNLAEFCRTHPPSYIPLIKALPSKGFTAQRVTGR